MDRALVVVDDSDSNRKLLAESGQHAAGVDADLVLFSWLTTEEYESDTEALSSIERAEHTNYGTETLDVARAFATDLATDVFDEHGVEVDYDVAAAVADDDELAETILTTAESRDCDYIYLVGRKRSPTGKVLFGDVAQQVILNFDGFVAITTE